MSQVRTVKDLKICGDNWPFALSYTHVLEYLLRSPAPRSWDVAGPYNM